MSYYKKEDVIGISYNGFFHVDCYDGNFDELEEKNILKTNDIDEEDSYFCDKCGKKI